MTPSVSIAHCGMCYSGKCLKSLIGFEAERGYRHVLCSKMRCNNVLFARVSRLCYRSKYKAAGKLLDDVHRYDTASIKEKILEKVSMSMGYDGLDDFIENERSDVLHIKDVMGDFDSSLARKQFPSITFGRSLPVELYDDRSCQSLKNDLLASELCETILSDSEYTRWIDPDSPRKIWPSTSPCLPNTNSLLGGEEVGTWTAEATFVGESSKFVGLDVEQKPASVELILDKSISCIDGLSKKHLGQLENCGFHTIRKLLHHFPRTYADLQNAQSGIDDGQYLICIGKILSSRYLIEGPFNLLN